MIALSEPFDHRNDEPLPSGQSPADPAAGADEARPEVAAAEAWMAYQPALDLPRPKVWTPLASLLMLLATIGGQLAVGLVAGVAIAAVMVAGQRQLIQNWSMAVMLILAMASNLLLLLVQRRRQGAKPLWDAADFRNPLAWIGAGVTLLACFAANAIRIYFVPHAEVPALNRDVIDLISGSAHMPWGPLLLVFLSTVVLAPLTEEWLFRGILQQSLGERWSYWVAVPVTALVFGLLHGLDGWWVAATYGLVIGLLATRLRSLIFPMMVHGLLNLTVFVLMVAGGASMR